MLVEKQTNINDLPLKAYVLLMIAVTMANVVILVTV